MIKSLVLSALVVVGSFGSGVASVDAVSVETVQNEAATIELDVFFMYGNENGTYWLDPAAEYENVIYVGYEDLEEWSIDFDGLEHGIKLVGTFDNEGWELFGLEYDNGDK